MEKEILGETSFDEDDVTIPETPGLDFSSDDSVRDPSYTLPKRKKTYGLQKDLVDLESAYQEQQELEIPSEPNSITGSNASSTPSRKRKKQPKLWKQNVRKNLRQMGKEYINTAGNIISKKKVKLGCSPECQHNCSDNFTLQERERLHDDFWKLPDIEKGKFYSHFIEKGQVARSRVERSRKKSSYKYFFEKDGNRIQICRNFFLRTLDISERRIYYHFRNRVNAETSVPLPVKHGKHTKHCLPESKQCEVRRHIESFPHIDSHYCRSDTQRQYLESNLTIRKMYDLYRETSHSPVKYDMYRKIFNYEFSLAFFVPRKDQCDKCTLYRTNLNPTIEEKTLYESHLKANAEAKEEKNRDKSNEIPNEAILCYDLQNVFNLPRGNASNFYYKRKFAVYNLTAHCNLDKTTYCALWPETMAGRSGNDIASALLRILKQVVANHLEIKSIILWSDSCIPQNRNQVTTTLLLKFLHDNPSIDKIVQKFSEPGHSRIQELDAVHSAIDRHLRGLEIHSPVSLLRNLNTMNYPNVKLKLMQLSEENFLAVTKISGCISFQEIAFSKIKVIEYTRQDLLKLRVRYDMNVANVAVEKILHLNRKCSFKSSQTIFNQVIPKCALKKNITTEKIKDIKSMLPYMPSVDSSYYKAVLKI